MSQILPIHKILFEELIRPDQFSRIPEKMVMDDEDQVDAYDKGSSRTGPLAVIYRFLAEQACLRIAPGDRVLDLGCASGQLTHFYSILNPQSEFVGIDLSDKMIQKAKVLEQNNLRFVKDDATRLQAFEDSSFDMVISSTFFHQLPNAEMIQDVMKSAFRVLKPNGKFLFSDILRPQSRKSVDLYAAPYIKSYPPLLLEDYKSSLLAGFSAKDLLRPLEGRQENLEIYATALLRFFIMFGTPKEVSLTKEQKQILNEYASQFNKIQKWDLRMLKLFLIKQ